MGTLILAGGGGIARGGGELGNDGGRDGGHAAVLLGAAAAAALAHDARESVAVARHLQLYPADGITDALEGVLAFDAADERVRSSVAAVFERHGIRGANSHEEKGGVWQKAIPPDHPARLPKRTAHPRVQPLPALLGRFELCALTCQRKTARRRVGRLSGGATMALALQPRGHGGSEPKNRKDAEVPDERPRRRGRRHRAVVEGAMARARPERAPLLTEAIGKRVECCVRKFVVRLSAVL